MNKTLVDFVDRVGSTAVQAFFGSLGAAELTGLGDLKSTLLAAAGAALVAVVKVIGANAAAAQKVTSPVVTVAPTPAPVAPPAVPENLEH